MTGWGNKVVAALVGAALVVAAAGMGGAVAAEEEARGSELTSGSAVAVQEVDDGVKAVTLRDAIAMALERSTAAALADIALEEARLAYEEAKANQMLRPSVVALQQAESAWFIAQRNHELARQEIVLAVEQGYYDVLRADLALDLAERTLAQSQAQLESTRARHEQGMLSAVDLLAAEMQVANAEVELNRARSAAATARMRLNRQLGRPLNASLELVDQLVYEPIEVNLEEALASAREHRLELRRARDTVQLRETELRVSDNPYTPQLEIERARIALRRAQLELAEREADIILEVEQNYQSLLEAQARVPIQETNVVRARENLRISEARYEAGVITAIDLVDAQRSAFQAETQAIQAAFDYNVALARFFRSAGLDLDAHRGVKGEE